LFEGTVRVGVRGLDLKVGVLLDDVLEFGIILVGLGDLLTVELDGAD